jgi:hypothetical protein
MAVAGEVGICWEDGLDVDIFEVGWFLDVGRRMWGVLIYMPGSTLIVQDVAMAANLGSGVLVLPSATLVTMRRLCDLLTRQARPWTLHSR